MLSRRSASISPPADAAADRLAAPIARRSWIDRIGLIIEYILAITVIVGLFTLIGDLFDRGFLPEPFFHDKSDSFMDWYNPAYWSHHRGAYDDWLSIYPPLSFLFLWVFSRPSCFVLTPDARHCDPQGIVIMTGLLFVNMVLCWMALRKIDKASAPPRSIALGFGLCMLFGWERGNLFIPCFTCFVLAYGNLLKQSWLRTFFAALTVNFKPYLMILTLGYLLRRDWRRVEYMSLAVLVVYLVTYFIFQDGDPHQLISNITGFAQVVDAGYSLFEFTTTYDDWIRLLNSEYPITNLTGSRIIETIEIVVPTLIKVGIGGVVLALIGGAVRPGSLSRLRMSNLALIISPIISRQQGAYSLVFIFFLVFMEKRRGLGRCLAILCVYLWCLPLDFTIWVPSFYYSYSFLTNRAVTADLPITVGQLLRPGALLLLQYGLVMASFGAILRHAGLWPTWLDRWPTLATRRFSRASPPAAATI